MCRRIAVFLLSFIVVYSLNFFIPRLMPGDPFSHNTSVSGEDMEGLSPADLKLLKKYYGMDKPMLEQFRNTVRDNLRGEFGQSILYKKPVIEVIHARLPWTVYMAGTSLLISSLFGTWLSLFCLKRQKTDRIIYNIMSVLGDIPSFIIGILLLFLIAAQVKWIPLAGNVTQFKTHSNLFQYLADVLLHSLMPVSALVLVTIPAFYFTARTSFKTVTGKAYIGYAHAKGLKERIIKYKYVMLNGIMPVVARVFLSAGVVLSATMLIETVFAYPGLGKVLRDAVVYRDYILIQGVFLFSTALILICSLISDLINDYIERVRG